MVDINTITLTKHRRDALLSVQRGEVQFRTVSADYIVDGLPVGGWVRRTYSDVRRAGLITYTDGRGDRSVRLTRAGERALEPSVAEGDTPSEDAPVTD